MCARLEGSLPVQVRGSAVEVSGFNSPRPARPCSVHRAAAASASTRHARQLPNNHCRSGAAHSAYSRLRLGEAAEVASEPC